MSVNPELQPSSFPLEGKPFVSWLPASDTRKFEGEKSEIDDNTLVMLKDIPESKGDPLC